MDGFQLTVIAKAVSDRQWQDDPARHERRGPASNDRHAKAGATRTWSAVRRVIAAGASAVARWRAEVRPDVASTPLPTVGASPRG